MLAQSPSLDAPARTVVEREPAPGVPGPRVGRGEPRATAAEVMVGRDREVRVLRGALADAVEGQGRLRADPRPGRHRQEPAAAGGTAARRGRGRPGADRPGQPAGARLRVRRGPPAVRGHPQRPDAAHRAAARVGLLGRLGVRRDPRRRPSRAGRRVVRGAARPVLADRQPGRAAAGGAGRRRRAVVRHRLAARAGLPAAPAGGTAGAHRRDPAHRRDARRRAAARRAGRGPRDGAGAPGAAGAGGHRGAGARPPRRRRAGPVRRAPATARPAATRCCCASCCARCRSRACDPTRRTPTR